MEPQIKSAVDTRSEQARKTYQGGLESYGHTRFGPKGAIGGSARDIRFLCKTSGLRRLAPAYPRKGLANETAFHSNCLQSLVYKPNETTGNIKELIVGQPSYQFDHDWVLERERLRSLERVSDPSTIRTLQEIGVSAKWHCLEVGAGGGSIAEWLCQRVGAAGHVVAADIEIKFLKALDYPNLAVLEHNLIVDELPESEYDLVHERSVLAHLPEREDILQKLANAVKPGGWLFVEEPDCIIFGVDPSVPPPMRDVAKKVDDAIVQVLENVGADAYFGGRIFGLLRSTGFESVQGRGEVAVCQGGTNSIEFFKLTAHRLRPAILASGHVTEMELEETLTLYDDAKYALRILMAHAWGRKPIAA